MLHKISIVFILFAFFNCSNKKETKAAVKKPAVVTPKTDKEAERLHQYAQKFIAYAKQNGYNTETGFLFDIQKSSGSKRFYVYDFKRNKIIHKGLVTHGNCGEAFLAENKYGNTVGCNCSSLGKYKIGKKYYGKFGLAYKLHGLNKTNDKAFERFVVLHAHSCVPDDEVNPYPICQSNGCPTVAPNFLQTLSTYIDESKKPLLLWIYE